MISGTILFFRTQAPGLVGIVTNNRISNRVKGLFNAAIPDCHGRKGPFSVSLQRKVLMASIASAPLLKLMQLARLILVVPTPAIYCTAGSLLALAALYLRRKPHNAQCRGSQASAAPIRPRINPTDLDAALNMIRQKHAARSVTVTPEQLAENLERIRNQPKPVTSISQLNLPQAPQPMSSQPSPQTSQPAPTATSIATPQMSKLTASKTASTTSTPVPTPAPTLKPAVVAQKTPTRTKPTKIVIFKPKTGTRKPVVPLKIETLTIKANKLVRELLRNEDGIAPPNSQCIDIRISKEAYRQYLIVRNQKPQDFIEREVVEERFSHQCDDAVVDSYIQDKTIAEVCGQQKKEVGKRVGSNEITSMNDVKNILSKGLPSEKEIFFEKADGIEKDDTTGIQGKVSLEPKLMSVGHFESEVILRIFCGGITIA
jgi:hypothetical protein